MVCSDIALGTCMSVWVLYVYVVVPKVLSVVHILKDDNIMYINELLLSWAKTEPWFIITQREHW